MVYEQDIMLTTRSFKLCVVFTIFVCTISTATHGSNILVINPFILSSHSVLFSAVMEELIPRGHNVTYLSVTLYTGHLKSKITQHFMKSDVWSKVLPNSLKLMQDALNPYKSTTALETGLSFFKIYKEEPCSFLENEVITNIMNSTVTYDVIILNAYASECFYSIGYMKKIPVILLSASFVSPWHYASLGIDPYFGVEKSYLSSNSQDSLIQRTLDILKGNFFMLYLHRTFASRTEAWLVKNYPNINFPPFKELEKNFSLLMVNAIPAMGYARSESPMVINIGGIHVRQPQKLPPDLEKFISTAEDKGFIYFSLGSAFQTEIAPKKLLNTFLEAFKQLPYRVLMKWNDNSTSMPNNVLSSSWLPQQDILGDPRLRAFVTHAGALSLQEAASHGVPVILLPIIFDQFTNAELAEKVGYGIQLDIKTVTTPLLVDAIRNVIDEPRFKNVARSLSSAIRDVPNTPQELVTWWTEYVIRNGGTERLRTARQKLPWYQQQQLDVFFLLSSITLIIVWIFYQLVSRTYRIIKCLVQRKEKLA